MVDCQPDKRPEPRPFAHRLKRKVYRLLESRQGNPQAGRASLLFDTLLVWLILLNSLAIVVESLPPVRVAYGPVLVWFECFSVLVFTLEYGLRLWTADLKYPSLSPFKARFRLATSPLALIDLLSILPFYLPLLVSIDLRALRILRLMRLLRILKLNRYHTALRLIGSILKEKKGELTVTLLLAFMLLFIASTLMYYLESEAQPAVFPHIPATFWWAVVTLTTVGYGDVYPVTGWGKVISGTMALLGIGLVALPTAIISSSFLEKINARTKDSSPQKPTRFCPHCGEKIAKE